MAHALYRLDIAPLTPLPLTRSPFFSYRSETLVALGSLVEIPFGKRALKGIVYAAHPLPGRAPLWLKPIHRVIRNSWLTKEQRQLAQALSEEYFSSLGNTLKHFVFPLSKKDAPGESPGVSEKPSRSTKKAVLKTHCLLTDEAYWNLVLERLKSGSQKGTSLILVPDLLLLDSLTRKLETLFPNEVITLSSQLTPKNMQVTWAQIRCRHRALVIGTRQALFAPFHNLKQILMLFPEERLSYKQWDMTPYYETAFGAKILATLHTARLEYITTSPGLDMCVMPSKTTRPSTHKSTSHQPGSLFIIDQRKDGAGARARVLSKFIETKLKNIATTDQVLFIAKERGVTGVLVCLKCKTALRCPQCEHVLAENQDGSLRCLNCHYYDTHFPKCKKCHGLHFKSLGIGTVRLEQALEKQFPEKKILRIDRDTLTGKSNRRSLSKSLEQQAYNWIVTTPAIGTLLQLPKQALIVMLEADQALAFPDFEGEERVLIEIERLRAKLTKDGVLALQTFTPEERVWTLLQAGKRAQLIEILLEERHVFRYPPVTAMIHIGALPQSQALFSQLYTRFKTALTHHKDIELSPLYKAHSRRNGQLSSFLIKYPADSSIPKELMTLLKRESAHIKIDVHPLKIH